MVPLFTLVKLLAGIGIVFLVLAILRLAKRRVSREKLALRYHFGYHIPPPAQRYRIRSEPAATDDSSDELTGDDSFVSC